MNNENSIKHISHIDLLKSFGIILVVMGHVGFGSYFDKFIHGFHMPLFFFISGILYENKYSDCEKSLSWWVLYVKKKSCSLLVPYVCFGVIYYCLWLLINYRTADWYSMGFHLVWTNNVGLSFAGALWFLTALWFTEMVYALVDYRLSKIAKYVVIAILSIAGFAARKYFILELPWSLSAGMVGLVFFALGAVYTNICNKRNWIEKIENAPCTIIFGCLAVAIIFINDAVNMRKGEYANIGLFLLGAVLAILTGINISKCLSHYCSKMSAKNKVLAAVYKWLLSVGCYSITFLCMNQVVILGINKAINGMGIIASSTIVNLVKQCVVLMLTLMILFMIDYIIRNTALNFMIGKIGKTGAISKEMQSVQGCDAQKRGTVLAGYMLTCVFIIVMSIYKRTITNQQNAVLSESVTKPTPYINICEESNVVSECLEVNTNYLVQIAWNEVNPYAFQSSSTVSMTPEKVINQCTIRQKYLQNRSVGSMLKGLGNIELFLPNLRGEDSGNENAIRPWAHMCYVLAGEWYFGADSAEIRDDLCVRVTKLVRVLARNHCANASDGWGDSWQSALWSSDVAFASWLLWDELDEETRIYVSKMVELEADRFLNYNVPYYADEDNRIAYPGDTKGEENAWNSKILALAVCMYPDHVHGREWESKLYEMMLSSTAKPEDTSKHIELNSALTGEPIRIQIYGSNINSDGTVVNHNKVHVDYSSCILEGLSDAYIIYALSGKDIPDEITRSMAPIYTALVNVDLGEYNSEKSGRHFYERSENGTVLPGIDMPEVNDWGGNWYASYYLNDIMAECFALDAECTDGLKAMNWADAHINIVQQMLGRESERKCKGQLFMEEENNFVSGELYQAYCLMKAHILRVLFTIQ